MQIAELYKVAAACILSLAAALLAFSCNLSMWFVSNSVIIFKIFVLFNVIIRIKTLDFYMNICYAMSDFVKEGRLCTGKLRVI